MLSSSPAVCSVKKFREHRFNFTASFQGAKHLVFLCTGAKAKHFHHISQNVTGLKTLALEEMG